MDHMSQNEIYAPVSPDSGPILGRNGAARARVVEVLRDRIDRGGWRKGDVLPPERDLARELGVSRASIQRGLAVLEDQGIIEKHDGHTRTVAVGTQSGAMVNAIVVLSAVDQAVAAHRSGGWLDNLQAAVFQAIRKAGYYTLSVDPAVLDGGRIRDLAGSRPPGVLIPEQHRTSQLPDALIRELQLRRIPFVVYGDDTLCSAYDHVYSDHWKGAYELTAWLIAQGRRNILQLLPAGPPSDWKRCRREGYEAAMREAGLSCLPVMEITEVAQDRDSAERRLETSRNYLAGCLMAATTHQPGIDAVFLPTDGHICAAAAACKLIGKTPNEDIWLAGYDNYWQDIVEQQVAPARPVITVDKRHADMGAEMFRLLAERISNRADPTAIQRSIMAPQLLPLR